ncbi:MAG TPA: TIGR03619 family F420-dependent LLM class oxidoreductase [Acidimicrobiales bacterium]|nr:TIGR03619 family F420-dependent LLM class oxidoreductase [Acidimicrobiales bacterium]
MQLGIVTPIVNLNPRFEAPAWERDGTMADVVAVAREAERLDYRWISCPEHIAIPEDVASVRGGRYWDPLVTLSYVAASTTRIGLLSHVVVLGYHHPLEIVKRYGTLDTASGGRVILGVGVGSLRAEFDLLGVEFDGRGARADDALRAIRASFGQRSPTYAGTHYRYSGFFIEPSGIDRRLPIWVGGRTRRSLRRALELGDGWIPFGLSHAQLQAMLAAMPVAGDRAGGGGAFDVILAPEPALDPSGDPSGAAAIVTSYAELGATGLSLRFRHSSRDHYMEQLAAMAQVTAEMSPPR